MRDLRLSPLIYKLSRTLKYCQDSEVRASKAKRETKQKRKRGRKNLKRSPRQSSKEILSKTGLD